MTRRLLLTLTLALCCAHAPAQTVFVVRHAERTGDPDPPLNEQGRRRAEALARILSDAQVRHFVVSETIRARQTAEPAAARAGRSVEIVPATEIERIAARALRNRDPRIATLVVGHRSTVPKIVAALGGGAIPPLDAGEHDRIVVVTPRGDGTASVVTLRYP